MSGKKLASRARLSYGHLARLSRKGAESDHDYDKPNQGTPHLTKLCKDTILYYTLYLYIDTIFAASYFTKINLSYAIP